MENFKNKLLKHLLDTYLLSPKPINDFIKNNMGAFTLNQVVDTLRQMNGNGFIELHGVNKVSPKSKIEDINLTAKILQNGKDEVSKNISNEDLKCLKENIIKLADALNNSKSDQKLQELIVAIKKGNDKNLSFDLAGLASNLASILTYLGI